MYYNTVSLQLYITTTLRNDCYFSSIDRLCADCANPSSPSKHLSRRLVIFILFEELFYLSRQPSLIIAVQFHLNKPPFKLLQVLICGPLNDLLLIKTWITITYMFSNVKLTLTKMYPLITTAMEL